MDAIPIDLRLDDLRDPLASADTPQAAPDVNEESVVLKACANMQLPKFVREDVPLFLDMLSDLFPSVEPEDGGNEDLIVAIKEDLAENRLQVLSGTGNTP